VLKSNLRDRFTADDFEFVVKTLARDRQQAVSLVDLLADEHTRDAVLDLDAVYQSIIDGTGCLKVSTAFYFYVLTRRCLKDAGLPSREVCDYIARVLWAFSRYAQAGDPQSPRHELPYVSDLLIALSQAGPERKLQLKVQVGDTSLFLSGIFHERVLARRERRGGPDLDFYEQIGQELYRQASHDRLARDTGSDFIFLTLAQKFHEIRCALNDMADRVLHLSNPPALIAEP
jgi:hypothetical protein